MIDYYNLLGVPPDAPAEAVRAAFRNLAKRYHPDAQPHLGGAEKEARQRRFIQLAQVYDTLGNPERRQAYDRKWRAAFGEPARPAAGSGRRRQARSSARPRASRNSRTERGPNLDELLREVETLLGRFGLDLKQPVERLLDELLNWAREIFRQVSGAWAPAGQGAPSGSRRTAGSARSSGQAASSARGAGSSEDNATGGKRRGGAGKTGGTAPNAGAGDGGQAVETELKELKRRAQNRPARDRNASTMPHSVDEELKRLKRRLGKS
ncbi:MAG: J domain-containing protein [SAR324 cluster bacterium]|nr:J domain-containing protein [SAR324 cluster bacterium]